MILLFNIKIDTNIITNNITFAKVIYIYIYVYIYIYINMSILILI